MTAHQYLSELWTGLILIRTSIWGRSDVPSVKRRSADISYMEHSAPAEGGSHLGFKYTSLSK